MAPAPLNMWLLTSTAGGPIPTSGATHSTSTLFCIPVPTPSISANLASNGILWAVENSNTDTPLDCRPAKTNGAVLHAYDATNVATELYNSGTSIQTNSPTKFLPPTIFNGRVYVGTYQGLSVGTTGELDVFGLCANGPVGHCI